MNASTSNSHLAPEAPDNPGGKAASLAAQAPATGKPPVWRQDDGAPVSCTEKIKVLNENYAELRQMAQDALEDALLVGCSEAQLRSVLHELVDSLHNPYPGKTGRSEDPGAK
jgi:hypothetical protein